MNDPLLSECVAACETSRFGAPNLVDKDRWCAPTISFRNLLGREVIRVTIYGTRALVAVLGDRASIPVRSLPEVRGVLDAEYERLEAKGIVP